MATAVQNVPVERLKAWEFQTPSAVLVPFSGEAKKQFSDDFLVSLYVRMVQDDLLHTVYPEGDMSLQQFMAYCLQKPMQILCENRPSDELLVADPNDATQLRVGGFGWLYDFTGPDGARMSKVGFVFFKEYWGKKLTREMGSLLIKWWIEVCKIDVLYGTLLASNRVAVNFAKKFGFRELCVLPKFYLIGDRRVDGRAVCLEKEDFRPYDPSRKEKNNGKCN